MFVRRFVDSLVSLRACTMTMNRHVLHPLRYPSRLARGWRRGPGERRPFGISLLELFWGLVFGIWNLPPVHEQPPSHMPRDPIQNQKSKFKNLSSLLYTIHTRI
jgi:hypothetical protein